MNGGLSHSHTFGNSRGVGNHGPVRIRDELLKEKFTENLIAFCEKNDKKKKLKLIFKIKALVVVLFWIDIYFKYIIE